MADCRDYVKNRGVISVLGHLASGTLLGDIYTGVKDVSSETQDEKRTRRSHQQ